MANNRMTEGVGKKIVEALKMQTEDINVAPENTNMTNSFVEDQNDTEDFDFNESDIVEETPVSETFEPSIDDSDDFESSNVFENIQPSFQTPVMPSNTFSTQQNFSNNTNFETPVMPHIAAQNTDEFEVPSNVAVLKQLISKLPAGVTKQTGALIIKQTMEALGISMKSVLQEAQQVQEGLNQSTRECQTTIVEYKKQISLLEKQAQKYQRQYAALNDIISLFIQTNF